MGSYIAVERRSLTEGRSLRKKEESYRGEWTRTCLTEVFQNERERSVMEERCFREREESHRGWRVD